MQKSYHSGKGLRHIGTAFLHFGETIKSRKIPNDVAFLRYANASCQGGLQIWKSRSGLISLSEIYTVCTEKRCLE